MPARPDPLRPLPATGHATDGTDSGTADARAARWADAGLAAALLAVDPHGLGGLRLRSGAGPVRDAFVRLLRSAWPESWAWRRLPAAVGEDRLLGGLDLTATLRAGRVVAQRGLLAQADGGLLVVGMAERLPRSIAALIAAALDTGEVVTARDGLSQRAPARCAVLALDEAGPDDDPVPAALADRLAFDIDLRDLQMADVGGFPGVERDRQADALRPGPVQDTAWQRELAQARGLWPAVRLDENTLQSLAGAALAFGVLPLRSTLLAARVARAHAAWCGRDLVDADDAAVALRLVLLPRATQLPTAPMQSGAEAPADRVDDADSDAATDADADAAPPDPQPQPQEPGAQADPADQAARDATPDRDAGDDEAPGAPAQAQTLQEQLVAAALAALPPGLLGRLALQARAGGSARGGGGTGAQRLGGRRGRPAGVRRERPGRDARLSLVDTLRAAVPWQGLRSRTAVASASAAPGSTPRVRVRPEDFHVRRYQQRSETTTVFVVDASGSAALRRLAEAKGAVELLLADCYVRRDSVALVAFRGSGADVLLPPTRSLVRARRALAALPGGGGTPLAAGLDSAFAVAASVQRRGDQALLVLLTDGRANVSRSGAPGREAAEADARQSARLWRAAGLSALVVDTSVRPHPLARQLADDMAAGYLPLPQADARGLSAAVGGALEQQRR